ncbi:MAG TPA: FAD-dependent oxidoreductase, partial [Candidatus Eisenbacteria bacterium]|nr:FAD-dependent oxidoreductase [Candidatus Eisenbacteria bacterium]
MKVLVIGAGPAGVMAALRAAELGASVTLVARGAFGGMAATDGPVPVRTLAHAARLIRGARQLGRYGISVSEPRLDYARLLARAREIVGDVAKHSTLRSEVERLGVALHENVGTVRFVGPHAVEAENGLRFEADRFVLCAGGIARRLTVPGAEFTATHSDAWGLDEVPRSLLVVGGGMTGLQVASIFHAFGSRVQVFQRGPRILPDEDHDVAIEVAAQLRASGMEVREGFGGIDRFEKTADGVRMLFSKDGRQDTAEASLAVVAIGWMADTT